MYAIYYTHFSLYDDNYVFAIYLIKKYGVIIVQKYDIKQYR